MLSLACECDHFVHMCCDVGKASAAEVLGGVESTQKVGGKRKADGEQPGAKRTKQDLKDLPKKSRARQAKVCLVPLCASSV